MSLYKYYRNDPIKEGWAILGCMQELEDKYKAVEHKFRAATFCTVAPNICGSSVLGFLHVTLLASGILKWLLDFWKIYSSLAYRVLIGRRNGKTPLVRSRRRWDNNIKINLEE